MADLMASAMSLVKVYLRTNLPKPTYKKTKREEYWIEMSDGVKLFATVTMPDAKGPFPCVLLSNPYAVGEPLYENAVMPVFAEQGYAGIYLRCRGTLVSEGEWLPCENEARDGKEVIDWISQQTFCDGNIGTYGSSYCGHTQWALASSENPAYKTAFISVFGAEPYDTFYRRGMFKLDLWSYWAATMMGDNIHKSAFNSKFTKKAISAVPQTKMPQVMVGQDYNWFEKWISSEKETDDYWTKGFWKEYADSVKDINVPMYLHGGWYDMFLRPELEAFRRLPEDVRKKSRFLIGPWGHSGFAVSNALKFPGEGKAGFIQMKIAIEWFDHQLKGKPYSQKVGVVDTYSIRENKWIEWDGDICPDTTKTLYFSGDKADVKGVATKLTEVPTGTQSLHYTYNPKKPTPNYGGNVFSSVKTTSGGEKACVVQPECGKRKDSLAFVSDEFQEDTRLAGQITANLFVSSSAEATAFYVSVMEMTPDGKSINIRDDITDIRYLTDHEFKKYKPGSVVKLNIPLIDCEWLIQKGSRIRVDIASSNYPAYNAHPNTTENWGHTKKSVVAKQSIYVGSKYPSSIELPVSTKVVK